MKKTTLAVLSLVAIASCNSRPASPVEPIAKPVTATPAANDIAKERLALFAPLPAAVEAASRPLTAERIVLGRALFYEKRLSLANDISCNSCHGLTTYGVDNQPTSSGHKAQRGGRNSPSVYNAAAHVAQFWDGRAVDVEAQAKGPILNPIEMAMPNDKVVVARLKKIPAYAAAFKAAFPADKEPVNYDNMALAIGAFERKLVTPSRWDKFLGGDATALSDAEKKGFNTFFDTGCIACHSGALVGGTMYQKLGAVVAWPNLKDNGRFDVTKQEADRFMFKVPSLRNVEKTGPYFHDGSVADLPTAITLMAKHQLGKDLSPEAVASIQTWLKSLTGELPTAYIAEAPLAGK